MIDKKFADRSKLISVLTIAALIIFWAARGSEVSIFNIIDGLPHAINFLAMMWPPDFSIFPKLVGPLIQTFQIAIMATIISAIIALPCSFLASRNITKNKIIYQVMRSILGVLRGVPPLLYALIFVAITGLGPFAGVLALTCHCIGTLGRFFSESIEAIDMKPIESMKIDGAGRFRLLAYGYVPGAFEHIIGYVLYYLEYNVRTGTILGLVGAGGIGHHLMMAIHLFKYNEMATILLIIVSIIVIVDRVSSYIRARIISEKY